MTDQSTESTIPSADSTTTMSTTISVPERLILGHNIDWWNEAMVVSLGFAGIAALAIALTTTVVVKLQRQIDVETKAAFSRYKLDAEKNINEAKAKALEAQVNLEKFRTPRLPTEDKAQRLLASLGPFSGTSVDAFRFATTPESARLSEILGKIFSNAGWHFRKWDMMSGSAAGVWVIIKDPHNEKLQKIADALVAAMNAADVPCQRMLAPAAWVNWLVPGAMSGPGDPNANSAPIRMIIGAKE